MRYKKIILGRLCYINTVLWRNHISFITLLREKLIWYFSNWNGRWQKLFGRCQNRQGTFYEGSSLGEVWIKILWEPWAVGQRLHPRLLVLFSQLFPLHPTSRQSPWPRGGQLFLCTGIFIGPESDHCLPLSVTNWLTDSLTYSCLVNLIDVTLACEDANSKLVDVVNVVDEDRVGNNLL